MRSYSGFILRGCFVLTTSSAPLNQDAEPEERIYDVERIEWDFRRADSSELITLSEDSQEGGVTARPTAMLASLQFVIDSSARRFGPYNGDANY